MKCNYCGKTKHILQTRPDFKGNMCEDCYFHIFGKLDKQVDRQFENGEITVWIKDEKVVSAWRQDGNEAIPKKYFEGKAPLEVINFLMEMDDDEIFCSMCSKKMKKKDIKLDHFAGHYCEKCAEKYKKENSRTCRICGKPAWKCVC